MRLSQSAIKTIKQKAIEFFGDNTRVYIFGSRVDDNKRGGDIDIFIKTSSVPDLLETKIAYIQALEKELGEQKIDVVIDDGKYQKAIYEIAEKEGIEI